MGSIATILLAIALSTRPQPLVVDRVEVNRYRCGSDGQATQVILWRWTWYPLAADTTSLIGG
jgi:hypothetical protein